jgi:hypothetical protein
MLTLYVYVDGSDLENIETDLLDRFSAFIAGWGVDTAHIVNVKRPRTADLREGDLPDWNLGLNFTVDRLSRDKIQELVRFLNGSVKETGREFAIGAGGEDWCSVGLEPQANIVEFLAEQLA